MSFARPQHVLALALAVAVTAIAGCTSNAPAPRSFQEATVQPYRLDSGDRLRISVFEQPSLSNTYTVDQAGYIAFPLIGQVAARGQTMPALEGAIAARLRQGYLRDPDVTIEVDRYRPVFVMGEVGRPGQYSYVPGMTAQNAIAIAGGFTSRGNQRDVDVTRKINDRVITGRTTVTAPVLAGDTIYVRERLF
ncbi:MULTISPECIES: polysaccharide biosynthesis/export family protein [Rhizobium/Agrobacterium group]|uniref:Polysaccharide biosynthesis/export family protein n=2 Tax=Neorhizobium TaxID=1525371 RepID=A0ABV0M0U2_9HYPH|nr:MULTISPECIES: polysaccharide biosynthesis/export family protein [Rhizobium/Agrobacterium group]KGD99314.1 sugar ABC transporter substrate-binding protein [Rhizobium sp. YS-1r]MCC2609305.1 polysaccharide export protein [Neorhizobium petrolearium]WGI69525.1 polysaccharide export protein [Neorhizobium petrolearium]